MNGTQLLIQGLVRKLWIATRFIVFGVGGFGLMLGFTFAFSLWVSGHEPNLLSPFLSFPLALAGTLMTLYGTGEWGRWAYLWVFLSIPVSLCLLEVVPDLWSFGKLSPAIIAVMAASLSLLVVRNHYEDRALDSMRRKIEPGR